MPSISNSRVVILATNGFEQSELEYPLRELRDRGAEVSVVTLDGNAILGWRDGDWGDRVDADAAVDDVDISRFDALVLPGGQMNPDILRNDKRAVALVRGFHDAGKPIAAICHGPWLLVEADVLRGRKATSYASIATDVRNAGGDWKDAEVVVDQGLVTSRSPKDLPAFVEKIVEEIEEGPHRRTASA